MKKEIWFKYYDGEITTVEVERYTDHYVWIIGKRGRTARRSTYDNYFPTKEDVIEHANSIIGRNNSRISWLQKDNELILESIKNISNEDQR